MIKQHFKNIIYSFKYLKPYWRKEFLIWLLTFSVGAISLVHPYLAKLVIDKAYSQRDFGFFIKLLIFGALIFIVSSLIDVLLQYLRGYVDAKVNFDLHKIVFNKIENLPYDFFQRRTSGEYIYKTLVESSQAANFITSTAPEFFYIFPKFILTCLILLTLNWKMVVSLVVAATFLYIPSFLISRKIRKQSERLMDGSKGIFEVVRESFLNMPLIKVFGKEKAENRRFIRRLVENIRLEFASMRLDMFSSFLDSWVNRLLIGIVTLYGGYNIIRGQLSLGSFTAIMLYINQLLGLQGALLVFFTHRLIAGSVSIQRLSETLDSWPEEHDDENAKEFLFLSGDIKFSNVGFGYYPGKPVLQNLNFKIRGGSAIGLVGLSGRGKTTLINLILKLYHISAGQILIDGKDVNLIRNKSLREQIGAVLQKPLLWNDTIKNNIKYSSPKATEEEVLRASRIACAHNFIKNLPLGYNASVGEEGVRLSEGQKQRIALARAVMKNPKILIIDEGMSSLDSQTEEEIIDNLKREINGATLIIVSHRLSTIKRMDMVYFLEAADKISAGSHGQLVELNSNYRELFAGQIEEEVNLKQ